jgi:hypothetical protein
MACSADLSKAMDGLPAPAMTVWLATHQMQRLLLHVAYFDKITLTTLTLNFHTDSLRRDRFAAWRAE